MCGVCPTGDVEGGGPLSSFCHQGDLPLVSSHPHPLASLELSPLSPLSNRGSRRHPPLGRGSFHSLTMEGERGTLLLSSPLCPPSLSSHQSKEAASLFFPLLLHASPLPPFLSGPERRRRRRRRRGTRVSSLVAIAGEGRGGQCGKKGKGE